MHLFHVGACWSIPEKKCLILHFKSLTTDCLLMVMIFFLKEYQIGRFVQKMYVSSSKYASIPDFYLQNDYLHT